MQFIIKHNGEEYNILLILLKVFFLYLLQKFS